MNYCSADTNRYFCGEPGFVQADLKVCQIFDYYSTLEQVKKDDVRKFKFITALENSTVRSGLLFRYWCNKLKAKFPFINAFGRH